MPLQHNPTRQRLVHTALELFASQGVTATTTRQIAESAGVNEVTLFRHFGSKHGLLLAVIEEAAVFTQMGQALIRQANQTDNIYQALKDYATACLQALDRIPEVVRSVVGEAGQFPAENRAALGRGFTQANHDVAEYFQTVLTRGHLHMHLPAEKLASLLNGTLLGYAVIEFTSEFHNLWQDRDDFLETLVTLFLQGAVSPLADSDSRSTNLPSIRTKDGTTDRTAEPVTDLPAHLVHLMLQRAKKLGLQDYALMYVLFGAGLRPTEVVQLERSHYCNNTQPQQLQITQGLTRQVPLNHWIMDKRYGSSRRNPLTEWLKSRKDSQSALFLNEAGKALSEAELRQWWHTLVAGLLTPEVTLPAIEQAQQTWCVEMLTRGIELADLQILTGADADRLQAYARRAREKAALEQAARLDQRTKNS